MKKRTGVLDVAFRQGTRGLIGLSAVILENVLPQEIGGVAATLADETRTREESHQAREE